MRQIEKSRTWALSFFVCSISIPGVGQFPASLPVLAWISTNLHSTPSAICIFSECKARKGTCLGSIENKAKVLRPVVLLSFLAFAGQKAKSDEWVSIGTADLCRFLRQALMSFLLYAVSLPHF